MYYVLTTTQTLNSDECVKKAIEHKEGNKGEPAKQKQHANICNVCFDPFKSWILSLTGYCSLLKLFQPQTTITLSR